MSQNDNTVIFYRRLSDKNIAYTILVCPYNCADMTKTKFINLMRGQPYTLSITNARRLAELIDRKKCTRYGIKECMSFMDVNESALLDSSLESAIIEEKDSDSIHSIRRDFVSTSKLDLSNEVQRELERLYFENHSLKTQLKYIQDREYTFEERERIFADRLRKILLQEKELDARIKKHESALSLNFILSKFDLTPEELQQTLSALRSQNTG